jgi:hypothetical protein
MKLAHCKPKKKEKEKKKKTLAWESPHLIK